MSERAEWVPSTLAAAHARRAEQRQPGACDGPYFPRPVAAVGFGTAVVHCPAITQSTVAEAASSPGSGAWLVGASYKPAPLRLAVGFTPPGTQTRTRTINGLSVTISYGLAPNGTNALLATVVAGGHARHLVLGLGLTPAIAEQILSSLHAG